MPTVAILPWLNLRQPITAGDYTLTPTQHHRFADPAEAQIVARVVGAHYDARQSVVHNPALLHLTGRSLTADLSADEETALFDFVELVAFAGLASRRYFAVNPPYCNRDNFHLSIARLTSLEPDAGLRLRSRRRDVRVVHMIDWPTYRVDKPMHVNSNQALELDLSLLSALLTARDQGYLHWSDLQEAIFNFNLANTDRTEVSLHFELISTLSAFQRLFDVGSIQDRLLSRFRAVLNRKQPVAKTDPAWTCLATPEVQARIAGRQGTTVAEVWLQDLCNLRGNVAHGRLSAAYQPIWSIENHLLLAAYIFPLLVKTQLAGAGHYTLADDDRFDLDVFERLACVDHFATYADQRSPWSYVRRRYCARLKFPTRPESDITDLVGEPPKLLKDTPA